MSLPFAPLPSDDPPEPGLAPQAPGGAPDTLPATGTVGGAVLVVGETVRVADHQALVIDGPVDANVLSAFEIGQGATLGLESAATTNVLTTIDFAAPDGTLVLSAGFCLDVGSQITGFGPGDTIDYCAGIAGLTAEVTPAVTLQGETIAPAVTTVSLSNAAGQPVGSLRLVGDYRGQLGLAPDGDGGTRIVCLCLLAGTRVRTPDGTCVVEALRPGDMVETQEGPRAVTWVGGRRFDLESHPQPEAVRPIRVAAGAFGPDLPVRDLWLSPDHAILDEDVLIPVRYLVNGCTIRPDAERTEVHYFHVELARHGVLYAEGLPVESYLDTGDREAFIRADAATRKPPAGTVPAIWESHGYAPLAVAGPRVAGLRARLAARAASFAEAESG
ncbi:Hint domain-containing protein [Acidisphaera rubrifaciens]|uniref:Hedgehog/Intein (Hint) domain-containing protein n=1 Tax=Acidisphaera rubrifaciens HS-AP3 TaxID=1231350 RepID=A0A0D6P4K9_9PROT|nr:Hint domain-containing protein [Acidisphaera rubrifaciens]GAN76123.1 hypothetical protein Asru_0056_06 [Acidisphaera rubrifaciens HS-AP3]